MNLWPYDDSGNDNNNNKNNKHRPFQMKQKLEGNKTHLTHGGQKANGVQINTHFSATV